ncbi:MAG: cytochrome b N-terminal domain-containing protein [Methylacidiphilales bacterium]|nr:cytochrome b N-terminal domain-containing protein [Candidatus Methylacidiphilales bacterium]
MKKFSEWVEKRLPLASIAKSQLVDYFAPKNFNFWYFFGSLALLVLVMQIITGIYLTMYYKSSAADAFASVEYIMRDVSWGWLMRYMHAVGASSFFIVIYLHMFRAFLYGSYKEPRELLWVIGMFLYLLLMAEAFMGYLLPWGQMSYWGAQVITELFGAIPFVGSTLTEYLRGDFVVSESTLSRFFALHVIALPMAILGVVFLHLMSLRTVGSNNPEGIEIKKHLGSDGKPLDGIPFYPYYVIKDIFGVAVFLTIFFIVVFYAPELGGLFLEHDNFIAANTVVTPTHIKPVWYFTPFYSILRAVPDKLFGVIAMGSAVAILFFVPWLDRCPTKSIRYRSMFYKILLGMFIVSFIVLGYLGLQPVTPQFTFIARICTIIYFSFFVVLFFTSKNEKCKPVPTRIMK